jgi:anti-sigma factor RsiW
MTSNDFTCQELVELVTEYLEEMLAPVERERFEVHLEGCPSCTVYLEQMRQTVRTLGMLTESSIPDQARAELLAAFREWKRG